MLCTFFSSKNYNNKVLIFIAVYIDSLVMISIEKSETNKKRALESETNLSQTMNCVLDWANAKSMAKIQYKFHGPRQIYLRFPKSNFVLDLVLDQKFSKSKIFLKGKFFFHNFSIKHDILRCLAKKKKKLVKIF